MKRMASAYNSAWRTVSAQKKMLEWERSVGMREKENKNKMKSFQKNKKPRALAENARVLKVHRNMRTPQFCLRLNSR